MIEMFISRLEASALPLFQSSGCTVWRQAVCCAGLFATICGWTLLSRLTEISIFQQERRWNANSNKAHRLISRSLRLWRLNCFCFVDLRGKSHLFHDVLLAWGHFSYWHAVCWSVVIFRENDLYSLCLIYFLCNKGANFMMAVTTVCLHLLQVAAYNSEGKSNPSQVVEFITKPDIPGCPCKPVLRGRVLPSSFKVAWGELSY